MAARSCPKRSITSVRTPAPPSPGAIACRAASALRLTQAGRGWYLATRARNRPEANPAVLETLSALARRLRPAAPALTIALALLVAATVVAVLAPTVEALQAALPLLFTALLWTICVLVFLLVFTHVPPPPGPQLRGLGRLGAQLNRGIHWLLAGAVLGLTLAAALLTLRLIGDWLS